MEGSTLESLEVHINFLAEIGYRVVPLPTPVVVGRYAVLLERELRDRAK